MNRTKRSKPPPPPPPPAALRSAASAASGSQRHREADGHRRCGQRSGKRGLRVVILGVIDASSASHELGRGTGGHRRRPWRRPAGVPVAERLEKSKAAEAPGLPVAVAPTAGPRARDDWAAEANGAAGGPYAIAQAASERASGRVCLTGRCGALTAGAAGIVARSGPILIRPMLRTEREHGRHRDCSASPLRQPPRGQTAPRQGAGIAVAPRPRAGGRRRRGWERLCRVSRRRRRTRPGQARARIRARSALCAMHRGGKDVRPVRRDGGCGAVEVVRHCLCP